MDNYWTTHNTLTNCAVLVSDLHSSLLQTVGAGFH